MVLPQDATSVRRPDAQMDGGSGSRFRFGVLRVLRRLNDLTRTQGPKPGAESSSVPPTPGATASTVV
jgi:hypothetical protein